MRTIEPIDWTLEPLRLDGGAPSLPASIPATMPGCVHTDLLAAGLIEEPTAGTNEHAQQWIGRSDWRYRATLQVEADALSEQRCGLAFDGLDTLATISLNGVEIGRTANMHRRYRFDVHHALCEGANELVLDFASAELAALAEAERLGDLPRVRPLPFNFIRKMACNFSWDWGPTLVTAGVWRPCRLEVWSGARIDFVRPHVLRANADEAVLEARIGLDGGGDEAIGVTAELFDQSGKRVAEWTGPASGQDTVATLRVPEPNLWWPRSHGEAYCYELTVSVWGGQTSKRRIGLRTVELDTSEDEHGAAFTLRVNDRPIFVRGANWIPDDPFPTRVERSRLAERLSQALAANMNLVRVWGGGTYESEAFYEECDRLGLLVWQDFAFACACYPEEEPHLSEVEAEARDSVDRLVHHPSLVLWCGCNENLWLVDVEKDDRGRTWREQLSDTPERGWGPGYYLELLPRIATEMDPSRPYWPGSPWSKGTRAQAEAGSAEWPNADTHGTMHAWDAWNEAPPAIHRAHRPRFAAEWGHAAPATIATLRDALGGDALRIEADGSPSAALRNRNRAGDGERKLAARLADEFGPAPAATFEQWHWRAQLAQARAVALAIGWHRSLAPRCMGTVVWQLNDCWPATSWALIDSAGRPKPAWFAARRMMADRILTIQPSGYVAPGEWDGPLHLHACNETDATWNVDAHARRIAFDGTVLAEDRLALEVPERGRVSLIIPPALAEPNDPAREALVIDSDGAERATWLYLPDGMLDLPVPQLTVTSVALEHQASIVTAEAREAVFDLTLLADQLGDDTRVDVALMTLLPGERVQFRLQGIAHASDRVLAERALRWAGYESPETHANA